MRLSLCFVKYIIAQIFENVESADPTLLAAAIMLANRHNNELRYLPILSELEDSGILRQAMERAIENDADAVASALISLRLTAKRMPSEDEVAGLSSWLITAENADRLLGSIRQLNEGSFLPALRAIEVSGHDVDWLLRPVLVQAIRKNSIGRSGNVDWLIRIFNKVAGWLSAKELQAYARLVANWTGFHDRIHDLPDADFLLFLSKLDPGVSRGLLAERIEKFDAIRFSSLIVSGDEMWNAYTRLVPNLGQDHSQKSEMFKALHDVLSGSATILGTRVANRALKLAPLLSSAAHKQLIRLSVSAAVSGGKVDAILTLSTLEPFKSYISRPSVASLAIAGLLSGLSRTTDGRTFVDRHVSAVAQVPRSQLEQVREILKKKLKSKDRRVANWASFVLEKTGFAR